MRSVLVPVLILVLASLLACNTEPEVYEPANGDIVFHTSRSSQSQAIQLVTQSRYSHMGILYIEEGQPLVYEAVEPVKFTPLEQWIARGEGGHYVAKRLREADTLLTEEALGKMFFAGRPFAGRHYDLRFEWSDDRVYCSELVWKIYQRALGIELGELQTFADFDLSDERVREKIAERWGDSLPTDEPVISPAAIFASPLLETVYEN